MTNTPEALQMLIGGVWTDASDGGRFESRNPATGEVWATVPEATEADIDRAVRAADAALAGPWGQLTATERGKCLRRLGDCWG